MQAAREGLSEQGNQDSCGAALAGRCGRAAGPAGGVRVGGYTDVGASSGTYAGAQGCADGAFDDGRDGTVYAASGKADGCAAHGGPAGAHSIRVHWAADRGTGGGYSNR